jgi:hypothetical protein
MPYDAYLKGTMAQEVAQTDVQNSPSGSGKGKGRRWTIRPENLLPKKSPLAMVTMPWRLVTSFKDALLFFGVQIAPKMSYRPGCYENRRTVVDCNGPISTHKYIVLTQKSGVGDWRDSRCYDVVQVRSVASKNCSPRLAGARRAVEYTHPNDDVAQGPFHLIGTCFVLSVPIATDPSSSASRHTLSQA